MNNEMTNTLNGIKSDLKNGKRTLKNIAEECKFFENQVEGDYSKAIFARLSDCKTRKEFAAVIASI